MTVPVASPIDRVTVLVDASRADFFHPPLETYHPVHYISPRITENLANLLGRRGVVICAGDASADLLDLARHVAWFVTRSTVAKNERLRDMAGVQEWAAAAAGKQRIHQALLAYEEPTLFILPRLLPKHIDYDFGTLLSVARRRNHTILVTTDMPLLWQRHMTSDLYKYHCLSLRSAAIYDTEALAKELVRAIIVAKQRLPASFVLRVARTNNIIGQINAAQLGVALRTPSQIDEFVELLCAASEAEEITEELVYGLRISVTDDSRRLNTWFLNLASTREQLLALAMTLFDGLAEDQFFAVFDILVEQTWGRRDPSLRGIDYADTDSVHQYVRFVKTDQSEVINAQLLDQRSLLITLTWEQYRRHILSTLPILVQLVRSSVELSTIDPALGGSNERRDNLRTIISSVLGDVGLVDQRVVEESLLQLALDSHVAVQSVAARAIARWRDRNHNQQMADLLSRWRRSDVALSASVRGIAEAQSERYGNYIQASLNLRKTVLLTIGYAAQFEPPNDIPQSLFNELDQAAREDNTDVLRFFCGYVLPLLLNKHLKQISRLIPQLARNRTLHDVIAHGLAQVYGTNADALEELLLHWYERTTVTQRRTVPEVQSRTRTDLLSCVMTCYGYLPYRTEQHQIVLDRIEHVIQHDDDDLVRISAIDAVFRLVGDDVEPIRGLLKLLQQNESRHATEIDLVVERLVAIGRRQRDEQKGGDHVKFVGTNRRQIALWVGQVRPTTRLEHTLLRWLQDRHDIVAQQVAVRVLVAIVAYYRGDEIERRQAERRRRMQRRQSWSQALRERIGRSIGGLHPFSFYNYFIVPPGVALTSQRDRRIVRSVLPELIDIESYNELSLSWFYDRLGEIDRGEGHMKNLAYRLEQAVRWVRVQAFVKVFFSGALLLIVLLSIWRFVVAGR